MLPEQTPGAWQVGWDMKDTFFNTGRWAEHADYMVLQDTETGEFYRHKFALFGGRTAVRLINSGSPMC